MANKSQLDHELAFNVPESGESNPDFDNCLKNPGHKNMIPVKDFKLEDFPEGWRHPRIFKGIMEHSQQVVKILVRKISTKRPDRYAHSKLRGQSCNVFGSGLLLYDEDVFQSPSIDCRLKNCTIPKPHKTTPKFRVKTATHVVFDDEEAEHTELEFFYNSDQDVDNVVVKGHVVSVYYANVKDDECYLDCVSHDLNLLEKILSLPPYPSVINALYTPRPESLLSHKPQDPLVVIISHPHGSIKHISHGTWVDFRTKQEFWTEEKRKSTKVKDLLRDFELFLILNPHIKESELGRSRLKEAGMHSFPLDYKVGHSLKRFVELCPEGTMYEHHIWVEQSSASQAFANKPCLRSYKYDGSITYTTATCPGSSGGPVFVFLPDDSRGYIHSATGHHFKAGKNNLNVSGDMDFSLKHEEKLESYIRERERKRETK